MDDTPPETRKPYEPRAIPLERYWTAGDRHEVVGSRGGGEWRIADLREAVKDCPVFELPLEWIDLRGHSFPQEAGLIDFARHMKHVLETDLSFPIIMDEWGAILDGRHRLVKALIEGRATIPCVRVPVGTSPTRPA